MAPDLTAYDLIVVNSSAGKDSMAMLAHVADMAADAGVLDRVVVVHNDLGTTDTGEPIEWEGVEELAREHAEKWGLRFETTRREQGGLWDQLAERGKWPSSSARWCTSDQKTTQGFKVVTRIVREIRQARGMKPRGGDPIQVLYCLGLRAQESTGRAAKPVLAVDPVRSNGVRTVTRWHPILHWSVKDVWDKIKASGLRAHVAYDLGMTRLSCALCVLASRPDLIRAARLRPQLAADFARREQEIGHQFRADLSVADIIRLAAEDDQPREEQLTLV